MKTLYLDLETFCAMPIAAGAHRYAEDAEVMLIAKAWDDAPVEVIDCTEGVWDTIAPRLQDDIDRAERVVIHNSSFDRTVLRHRGVSVPTEKITDSMVLALQHGLPGKLGQLCEALGVPQDKAKDKRGSRLINLFTKPRPKNIKIRRATRETHPDEWQEFIEYASLDVDAMREVLARTPRWNDTPSERRLWLLDQDINDRGVCVDTELAIAAVRAFDGTLGTLAARIERLTGGAVSSATQRDRMLAYLRDQQGLEIADLTKDTLAKLLRSDLSPHVREVLEVRQQASATSPAKYTALLLAASSDGRLRGTVQFCGAARTGRDAGRIFQPQNLPRTPDWFDGEVQELTVRAFKEGMADVLWDNISERCSMAVRGSLVAAKGKKLVIADLSNIEGRVLAWLANEAWKIEAFKAYDRGEGPDLYKVTAGRILGKDPADITKEERQLQGKVPELSGGFGGGVGAYRVMGGPVFEAMTDEEIQEVVSAWRAAHPRTKALWYDVERAAKDVIKNPGSSFDVRGLLRFDMRTDAYGADWLRIRLPSGRYLCYKDPKVDDEGCEPCEGEGLIHDMEHGSPGLWVRCETCDGKGRLGGGQIIYKGINQYTRQWATLETYGGKLVENIVQAIARDVFMSGLRRAEEHDYPVVLRVHDELVCEVPDSSGYTHEVLANLMGANPGWAIGLPLAAAGFETRRYRKD
jgi:DNA polymerase